MPAEWQHLHFSMKLTNAIGELKYNQIMAKFMRIFAG